MYYPVWSPKRKISNSNVNNVNKSNRQEELKQRNNPNILSSNPKKELAAPEKGDFWDCSYCKFDKNESNDSKCKSNL